MALDQGGSDSRAALGTGDHTKNLVIWGLYDPDDPYGEDAPSLKTLTRRLILVILEKFPALERLVLLFAKDPTTEDGEMIRELVDELPDFKTIVRFCE